MSTRTVFIGGHGKIALLLEPQLVDRGDTVTAVIRNPDQQSDVAATGAQAHVADITTLDVAQIADLIRGSDVVVWSAGAGDGVPERTKAIDRDAAIRSIDAAVEAGVRRYIMVSYFRAKTDHGVPPENSFFAYAEAKAAADTHLRASDLDWTIVAPSALTLDPPTGCIDAEATESGSVSRADVAAVIAAVMADPTTIGRTIRFNSGTVPIEEAIAAQP